MKSPNFVTKIQSFYASNRISLNSILGVILGLVLGLVVKSLFWPNDQQIDPNLLRILSLPGIIFIRCFLILIIPLLIASLSTSFFTGRGTISKDGFESPNDGIDAKKLLLLTFAFSVCFSTFTAFLGISLMAIFQPGVSNNTVVPLVGGNVTLSYEGINEVKKRIEQNNYQVDSLYNIILNVIPDNIISPLFLTSFTSTDVVWPANLSTILDASFVPILKHRFSQSFKGNMLGVCALSLILGIIIQSSGPTKTSSVRQVLTEIDFLVKKCMAILLRLMPGGMFFWMFTEALKMKSIGQVVGQLGYFYAIALIAFSIVLGIFYPLALYLFTRQNPIRLYKNIFSAILIAAGSTSSAIALPETMNSMKEKEGLTETIANSVLPLGMMLNMNGTAMYYPMVALFVAQMKGIQVDIFTMIILGIFSVVMSMGLPGSPGGGSVIVNHITYASVLGIDDATDVLAYIMAFEWIMERIRTPINIIGDAFVSKCIEQLIVPKAKNGHEARHGKILATEKTFLGETFA